ncbi:MAG: transketolase [Sandaracinaceae bacterium]|nr:transketolase [Sandaracinaceae bacterium]
MSETEAVIAALRKTCAQHRIDILEMITEAGSGHPGGSLSAIDLIEALYARVLHHDPKRPDDPDRDRFVLSKGHGVPALYAVLAHHGYFDRKLLPTLRKLGSPLQGHPVRGTAPGVEACTGSLGQGLSIAVGMALAARVDHKKYSVWCMMGDGEIQEGQVWEAFMSAGKLGLDGLAGILDFNKAQIDGLVEDVMPIEPIEDKARAFGWLTRRIDGHDYAAILDAYAWAQRREGKPKLIVADTIKGKGVSFMESELVKWHGVAPTREQCEKAVAEIRASQGGAR